MELKVRVLEYYGLLVSRVGDDKKGWTAHTMLDDVGSAPLPLGACTLAHIWPAEQGHLADQIASELKLPEGFYNDPRNYLILPTDAHDGFDNHSLLFLPAADGTIKVRRWRVEERSPEEAAAVAKYDGRKLTWPTQGRAAPHLPFMRLMAFRMLSAMTKRPVAEPDVVLDMEKTAALNASVATAGNEAVRDLCGRLSLF